MKFRGKQSTEKIEAQMAPMIDVVFQLLIFFMLTLKIVEPEGDFTVNMPIGASAPASDSPKPPVIKVRMKADPVTGEMYSMTIARKELFANLGGSQEEKAAGAFQRLNSEILRVIGSPNNPLAEDQEVELDPDYELNSKYLINAIGACRGRVQRNPDGTAQMIDYIKNIKFAPPREPQG